MEILFGVISGFISSMGMRRRDSFNIFVNITFKY